MTNLFENPTTVCYCAANGNATCTPCRERKGIVTAVSVDNERIYREKQTFKKFIKDYGVKHFWECDDPDGRLTASETTSQGYLNLPPELFVVRQEYYDLDEGDKCPNCGEEAGLRRFTPCTCTVTTAPCHSCENFYLNCGHCDIDIR